MSPDMITTKECIDIIQKCIHESIKNGVDVGKIGEKLGRILMLNCQQFQSNKLQNDQIEILIPLISIITSAWSAWILESKAICHYRKSQATYRDFLENIYFPNLMKVLIKGRNIAIEEKKQKREKGDTGKDDDVPKNILIPAILPDGFIKWK